MKSSLLSFCRHGVLLAALLAGGACTSHAAGLEACGYHDLNLVMEQLPSSWTPWYERNNDSMWLYNQYMDIYRYSDSDGSWGQNGDNEFGGWPSNAELNSTWGFNWGSALAMTVFRWYCECCEIIESDVIFNPAYSWTADRDQAEDSPSSYLYYDSILLHEMGHSWGMQTRNEDYNYSQPTVMHSYNSYSVQDYMTIHMPEAYLIRRQYDDQKSIPALNNFMVVSKYAAGSWVNASTDKATYVQGEAITVNNLTVENTGTTTLTEPHIRLYLSSNRVISTSDTQMGDWSWGSFGAEAYGVYDLSTYVPSSIAPGQYYVGALVTISGYSGDDLGYDDTTHLWNQITVNAQAPTGVTASDGAYTANTQVTWSAVSGAPYYRVSRATSSGGTKTAISSWQTATSFNDTSATPGVTYYYFVQAALNSSGSYASAYSSYDTGWRALAAPAGVASSDGTSSAYVRTTWSAVTGASYYRVYRATSSGGTKTALGSWQTTTSFDDTSATPGVTYYYFVVAATSSTGTRPSAYSSYDTGWRALAVPGTVAASDGTYADKVRVTWVAVSGASHYRVSRASSPGGSKTPVSGWIAATTYDDSTANPGVTYYYSVQSATDSTGTRASEYSAEDPGYRSSVGPCVTEWRLTMDNASPCGVTLAGSWTAGTTVPDFWGTEYLHDGNTGKGTKSATFQPNLPAAGRYHVYLWWTAYTGRASNVPVTVNYNGGSASLSVDQRVNGGRWNLLGTWNFAAGDAGWVGLSNTGTDGVVVADAVKFVPEGCVVVDDFEQASNLGSVTYTGAWPVSSTVTGYWDLGGYHHDGNAGKGTKSVDYQPNLPQAGQYEVAIWYTAYTGRANNVPVDVVHSGGTSTVVVNQLINGSQWVSLGTYNFAAGTGGHAVIRTTGTSGTVVADAVRFCLVSAPEVSVQLGATPITDGQAATIDFGSVIQGSVGPTRIFTVQNTGSSPLTTSALSVPPGYTITEGLTASLAPGASDSFTVRLDSGVVGTKSGQISFNNNDGDESPFNFPVSGIVLPPGEMRLTVDDAAATGVTLVGTWTSGTTVPGYWGTDYLHDGNTGKGTKSATFQPYLPAAGRYHVYLWWTAYTGRASNVPVTVNYDGGSASLTVDQRVNGARWNLVGTWSFAVGDAGWVRLSNTGTDGVVVADAVKFVPEGCVVVDDFEQASNLGAVTYTGAWSASSTVAGYWDVGGYHHDGNAGKGTKSVDYQPNLPQAGQYEVGIWYTAYTGRANNVPVDVVHSGGTSTVVVNQLINGSQWVSLGTYNFAAGTGGHAVIRTTGTSGTVVADAVRFLKLPPAMLQTASETTGPDTPWATTGESEIEDSGPADILSP